MRTPRAVLASLLLTACLGPPQRDVFVPPYAEKGCWARFYAEPGFAGPMRQLEGPAFVEALGATEVLAPGIERAPPQPLFSEVRSMLVGPHARIVAYAEPLFGKKVLQLPPGARMDDLGGVSLGERAGSFTMRCDA